jgi:diadenosine tetraphosphate (Ap4A) HIT family hydrolase
MDTPRETGTGGPRAGSGASGAPGGPGPAGPLGAAGEPSAYLRRLPIGERIPLPASGVPSAGAFPYEGELRIRVLEPPVLPEPPRQGEAGAAHCPACLRPDPDFLWTDEHWRLAGFASGALPAAVLLQPRGHHDLSDLPPARAAELGAVLQRVERAITSLGGIARVHVNRWGDGAAHLHLFLLARPAGMLQLRGTCLPLWDDVLPEVPAATWAETNRRIARAMAADGGTAHR